MSDTAATPSGVPAGGDPYAAIEAIDAKLAAEEEAGEAEGADTDAVPDAQQPTSEAQPEDPDAGDDQSQDAEPEPPSEDPLDQLVRVKVRGEEREIPLREALAGYSRNEDYKAKTAEIAEQRRTLDAKQAEIQARAAQLDQLLTAAPFDPILEEGHKTDWLKLSQENPAEYVQKRAAYEQRQAFWANVAQERQRAVQEQHQQMLARSNEALSEALPEWRDETKRKELAGKVRSALSAYGFSNEELSSIVDHRVLLVALDAARHREAQAARQSAEAKRAAPPAPKVLRPNAAEQAKAPPKRDLLNKARNARRTDDQVDAILALLDE